MNSLLFEPVKKRFEGWNFEHTYTELPEIFYKNQKPANVPAPQMVVFNRGLAETLGLNSDILQTAGDIFSGASLPDGAKPIAQAYAGYQFGHFSMLGDGRAVLLGEHTAPNGHILDVQLKGSGQTAFSRNGDGYAALLPMLREYIISEAMYALGIPTTRSLAVVLTGRAIRREKMEQSAVLTRIAASHIRVGTFNYAAAYGTREDVRALADYSIHRHYPFLTNEKDKYALFLQQVAERQASLIAQWQCVGFIHGVMNTDNMAISGETIDYGPCAFMDTYHPDTVFSSIDTAGRYAYKNQPKIGAWNLARLAESLLGLITHTQANRAIAHYWESFAHHWLTGMRKKMNITQPHFDDEDKINALLAEMEEKKQDLTNTFRNISASNPAVIPRNHHVEEALRAAGNGDLSPLHDLLTALRRPYVNNEKYAHPLECSCGYQTFCGT
jgi:uncharacterized protein YdiU (UPF0061 family)